MLGARQGRRPSSGSAAGGGLSREPSAIVDPFQLSTHFNQSVHVPSTSKTTDEMLSQLSKVIDYIHPSVVHKMMNEQSLEVLQNGPVGQSIETASAVLAFVDCIQYYTDLCLNQTKNPAGLPVFPSWSPRLWAQYCSQIQAPPAFELFKELAFQDDSTEDPLACGNLLSFIQLCVTMIKHCVKVAIDSVVTKIVIKSQDADMECSITVETPAIMNKPGGAQNSEAAEGFLSHARDLVSQQFNGTITTTGGQNNNKHYSVIAIFTLPQNDPHSNMQVRHNQMLPKSFTPKTIDAMIKHSVPDKKTGTPDVLLVDSQGYSRRGICSITKSLRYDTTCVTNIQDAKNSQHIEHKLIILSIVADFSSAGLKWCDIQPEALLALKQGPAAKNSKSPTTGGSSSTTSAPVPAPAPVGDFNQYDLPVRIACVVPPNVTVPINLLPYIDGVLLKPFVITPLLMSYLKAWKTVPKNGRKLPTLNIEVPHHGHSTTPGVSPSGTIPRGSPAIRTPRVAIAPPDSKGSNTHSSEGVTPSNKDSKEKGGTVDKDKKEEKKEKINWRKGELLGTGGFGVVHIALNRDTGELMAVKNIAFNPQDAGIKERIKELRREVEVMKSLHHQFVCKYKGTEIAGNSLNVFMEYVPGGSILQLLEQFGAFGEQMTASYTRQILTGVKYLHDNGYMHRDIKGANILVAVDGSVKISDFGSASQIQDVTFSLKGTPYWMSPEMIQQKEYTFSADIWSLGCTVLEMLTGKPPWTFVDGIKNQLAVMNLIISDNELPLPPGLSATCVSFLRRCLVVDASKRATAEQLLDHPFVLDPDEADDKKEQEEDYGLGGIGENVDGPEDETMFNGASDFVIAVINKQWNKFVESFDAAELEVIKREELLTKYTNFAVANPLTIFGGISETEEQAIAESKSVITGSASTGFIPGSHSGAAWGSCVSPRGAAVRRARFAAKLGPAENHLGFLRNQDTNARASLANFGRRGSTGASDKADNLRNFTSTLPPRFNKEQMEQLRQEQAGAAEPAKSKMPPLQARQSFGGKKKPLSVET
eukprot:TRINITY_DN65748_c5_g2_i1.p1 TRINITY_DN65748_c5_g2~~TRINITY_DN65748_c5_g2_i1.p1  ORF type:complete len:1089 (-),score=97.91 TRINITY_DN65748_c5_g2_i1:49-3177(-)